MTRVLFVSEGNVGRSPMAEAFFARLARDLHEGHSAGTRPSQRRSPLVEGAMLAAGIDLGKRASRALTKKDIEWAEVVVVAGETRGLPSFGDRRVVIWQVPRIKEKSIEAVGQARIKYASLSASCSSN